MNPIDENTLHEWIFEYLEGNLGAEEQAALDRHLNLHPQAKVEFEAWQKTYLVPEKVTYPRKRELYRKGIPLWSGWAGAGMILILGLSLFLWFWQTDAGEMTPPTSKSILNQTVSGSGSSGTTDVSGASSVKGNEPPDGVQEDLVYIQKEQSVKMPSSSAPTTLPKSVPVVVAPLAGTDGGESETEKEPLVVAASQTLPAPELAADLPSEPEVDLIPKLQNMADFDTLKSVKVAGKSSKKKWKRRKRKGYVQPLNAIPLDGDAF